MNYYAITSTSYRSVTVDMPLQPGESRVSEIPQSLLDSLNRREAQNVRNGMLRATDWTQMADAPLTPAEKLAMSVYRQALRYLPSVPGFPDVPWPTVPNITTGAAGAGNGQTLPIG